MPNILLHIGRHKTGTSALQNAFIASRAALLAAGVDYPLSGLRRIAHHPIAEAIHEHSLRQSDFMALDLIRDFRAEIDCAQTAWMLISSEAFQRCQPRDVARLFNGHHVMVVVYLRDQLSYLQSSYLQEVQADAYQGSIEDFAATYFDANYQEFVDSWIEVFGERNVLVRIFQKNFLRNGDIVSDFFSVLLPRLVGKSVLYQIPANATTSRNPSLNGAWIPFKLRLNRAVPPEYCRNLNLYWALGSLCVATEEKNQLISNELARRILTKYGPSNKNLLQKLGYPPNALDGRFSPQRSAAPLGPAEFYACLNTLIEEEPMCAFLHQECYHAYLSSTPFYHALILSRHLVEDHLPLLRIVRQGQIQSFLGNFRQVGPWYVAAREHFDPEIDCIVAEMEPDVMVPITIHHNKHLLAQGGLSASDLETSYETSAATRIEH